MTTKNLVIPTALVLLIQQEQKVIDTMMTNMAYATIPMEKEAWNRKNNMSEIKKNI